MLKIEVMFEDVKLSALRHEGMWRVATGCSFEGPGAYPSLEVSLSDIKMGALLALMMDGEDESPFLDEALTLLSLEEVGQFTKAGLIP